MLKEFETKFVVKQHYFKVGVLSSSSGTLIVGVEDSFEAAKERITNLRGQEAIVKDAEMVFEKEMTSDGTVGYVITNMYERSDDIMTFTYVIEEYF